MKKQILFTSGLFAILYIVIGLYLITPYVSVLGNPPHPVDPSLLTIQ